MSEADFYPASGGQFRGSKYPGFTGGTTDGSGNVQPVGSTANVGQASGNNQSPAQVQQNQVNKGNAAAQTDGTLGSAGSVPSSGSGLSSQAVPKDTLGGTLAQAGLPFAGDVAGTAIGKALGTGAGFGEALGKGGEALSSSVSNLASGNFGGLLSSSSGSTGAAVTGGTSAGFVDGLPAVNVGTPAVDNLGENAISEGAGANAGDAAGNLGGGALAGVGTFAADLLSGKSVKDSAFEGAGAAVGGVAGSYFGPVGTVVGSWIGSQLGGLVGGLFGGNPSVGPNGVSTINVNNGHLAYGTTGVDNGADPNATQSVAQTSVDAINKILDQNNLTVGADPYLGKAGGGNYSGLGIYQGSDKAQAAALRNGGTPHSALDLWNYLLANNMITSKTPSAPAPISNTTAQNASAAPVLTPGSLTVH